MRPSYVDTIQASSGIAFRGYKPSIATPNTATVTDQQSLRQTNHRKHPQVFPKGHGRCPSNPHSQRRLCRHRHLPTTGQRGPLRGLRPIADTGPQIGLEFAL